MDNLVTFDAAYQMVCKIYISDAVQYQLDAYGAAKNNAQKEAVFVEMLKVSAGCDDDVFNFLSEHKVVSSVAGYRLSQFFKVLSMLWALFVDWPAVVWSKLPSLVRKVRNVIYSALVSLKSFLNWSWSALVRLYWFIRWLISLTWFFLGSVGKALQDFDWAEFGGSTRARWGTAITLAIITNGILYFVLEIQSRFLLAVLALTGMMVSGIYCFFKPKMPLVSWRNAVVILCVVLGITLVGVTSHRAYLEAQVKAPVATDYTYQKLLDETYDWLRSSTRTEALCKDGLTFYCKK